MLPSAAQQKVRPPLLALNPNPNPTPSPSPSPNPNPNPKQETLLALLPGQPFLWVQVTRRGVGLGVG